MSKFNDLTGKRFGRLLVIDRAESLAHNTRWNCICDCGNKTITTSYNLTKGRAKSCGCLSLEKMKKSNTKHGYRYTRLYREWCGMKKRCYNSKYEFYNRYGGRGIKVCEEWLNDFVSFKNWAISNGYNDNLELDRIDNDKDYEPNNCRWQNRTNQVRNRSNTIYLEKGKMKRTLKEWCEIYDISYKLAHARYKKRLSFEKIFSKTKEKK